MPTFVTPLDVAAGEQTRAAFASPFDQLGPSPLARRAAEALQDEFRRSGIAPGFPSSLLEAQAGGKMFGVLVVADASGRLGFLRAFSGTLGGRFDVEGYVPPIFDVEGRAAVEVEGERVVTELTRQCERLAASPELLAARARLQAVAERQLGELAALGERHRKSRALRREERERQRAAPSRTALEALAELDQQSRGDKAERRRLERTHSEERGAIEAVLEGFQRELDERRRLHQSASRALMRRIHDSYRIVNLQGRSALLRELFAPGEPPGGAGDCAAPKLLAYAFAHALRPLAIAEFWWGAPPAGGGRVHGAFYPACREKCGPLLPFMLEGLDVAAPRLFAPPDSSALELAIVYEDDCIVVVDKPCGLLSVPARGAPDGDSVLRRLRERYPSATGAILPHRLDLDTSGLLVAARDEATHAHLQRQFLARSVGKVYVAIVDAVLLPDEGCIDLPLRVDLDDRPRQIVDPVHGRPARTEWRVLERGAATTRVELRPRSGRTHQLRVHAAHPLGLGAAVAGDRLYGRCEGARLLLHAASIAFDHPRGGRRIFESPAPF